MRYTSFRDTGSGKLTLTGGAEYERMDERRKGFINDNGVAGALKRDEDDAVSSTDFYAQGEWRLAERWSVLGGVRSSHVASEGTRPCARSSSDAPAASNATAGKSRVRSCVRYS